MPARTAAADANGRLAVRTGHLENGVAVPRLAAAGLVAGGPSLGDEGHCLCLLLAVVEDQIRIAVKMKEHDGLTNCQRSTIPIPLPSDLGRASNRAGTMLRRGPSARIRPGGFHFSKGQWMRRRQAAP